MDAKGLGLLYCVAGLTMAVAQSVLTKPAVRLMGERNCVMLGNGIRGVFYLVSVNVIAPGSPQVCAVGIISTSALIAPCMASTISALAPEELKGLVIGTFQAVGAFGNFLGPLGGGLMYHGHIFLPFQCCVVFSFLTMALAPIAFRGLSGDAPAPNKVPLLNLKELDPEGQTSPRPSSRRASNLELLHTSGSFSMPNSLLTPDVGGEQAIQFGSLKATTPRSSRR